MMLNTSTLYVHLCYKCSPEVHSSAQVIQNYNSYSSSAVSSHSHTSYYHLYYTELIKAHLNLKVLFFSKELAFLFFFSLPLFWGWHYNISSLQLAKKVSAKEQA